MTFRPVEATVQEYVSTKRHCTHCGDDCRQDVIVTSAEEVFCCVGCQTVYQILHDHNLGKFYNINVNAGQSQKNFQVKNYEYLDDKKTQESLCSFIGDSVVSISLSLPSIHCSSCIWLIENISRINDGITHATVNYLEKKVMIHYDPAKISLKQVAELLSKIGYPPYISLNDTDDSSVKKIDRSIYYKLGISGFVFGNIMLLSFPEYLGMNAHTDSLPVFIRIINIILVLPVIFYCAHDYFSSSLQSLKQKHLNIDLPISIGILALFSKSLLDIMTNAGPGYLDSLAGLVFFLLIGKWFQSITYNRIKFDLDYKSYFPIAATILIDGKEKKLPLNDIKPKDILRIRHGELIPTDGKLLSNHAKIDYSFVTGEEDPILVEQHSTVYSGGKIVGSMVEVEVEKTVVTSYLTQLWNDTSLKETSHSGNVSSINETVAKYFTASILMIAILSFGYHSLTDIDMALNVFISVLIIACPCAVALSIPFTFGNIIRLLSLKNIFFKNTTIVEKCNEITYVVLDKTGTITNTKNEYEKYIGQALSPLQKQLIASVSTHSTHSASQMISNYLSDVDPLFAYDIEETTGVGIQGQVQQKQIKIGSAKFFLEQDVADFERRYPDEDQYNVYIQIDDEIVGAFTKKSHFKANLASIIGSLADTKLVSLVSGDNDTDKNYLQTIFKRWDYLLFQKSPFEKLDFIKKLSKKHKVAMVGDGLNDAGALMQSHVGIAVSQNASHFTPASDIILDSDQLEKLPDIFSICHSAVNIIYASYTIAICYNIVGLSFAIQGLLSPVIAAILMPLSSITVVVFGYVMSSLLIKKYSL